MKTRFVLTFLIAVWLAANCHAATSGEIWDAYSSVSCLAKGNACTASVSGFASHFYNPAAVGNLTKKQWEGHLVVAEGHSNSQALHNFWETKSIGPYQLLNRTQNSPGKYHFESLSTFPSLTFRNFSFGILGSSNISALSDGSQLQMDSRQDVIPTLAFSRHFAGNLLRLGVSVKGILRSQLKGSFSHSSLSSMSENQFGQLVSEGFGGSVDLGLLLTLPNRFLPTLGLSWMNAMDTSFSPTQLFYPQANSAPEKIPQSYHLGLSVAPKLGRNSQLNLAADFRHIELTHLPFRKKLHLGLELRKSTGWYFWGGLNQMYLTGGVGLRLPGGHIEIGSYSKEIGEGEALVEDRRYFLRYTMSFGS